MLTQCKCKLLFILKLTVDKWHFLLYREKDAVMLSLELHWRGSGCLFRSSSRQLRSLYRCLPPQNRKKPLNYCIRKAAFWVLGGRKVNIYTAYAAHVFGLIFQTFCWMWHQIADTTNLHTFFMYFQGFYDIVNVCICFVFLRRYYFCRSLICGRLIWQTWNVRLNAFIKARQCLLPFLY